MRLKKRIKLDIEEFKKIISECKYFSDIIGYYKCNKNGGTRKVIKSIIKEYNISTNHFSKESPLKKYFIIKKECPYCHCIFETLNGGYEERKTCSLNCSNFYFKRHTDESKKKISDKLKGRKLSSEVKRKISLSLGGDGTRKIKKRKFIIINGNHTSYRKCSSCKKNKFILKNKRLCEDCKFSYYFAYRPNCEFDFNIFDYPEKFDLTLVKTYGIYSPVNKKNNLGGVSRDHLYSVKDGFENKIEPEIIKHPANCRLILNVDNQRKHSKSLISLEELKNRIEDWNKNVRPNQKR